MASIREYFDNDLSRVMSQHADWELRFGSAASVAIRARISKDFDANAKYWSFFIPAETPLEAAAHILRLPETAGCVLSGEGDSIYIESGFADYSERATSATLVFTKRVFFYIDALLDTDARKRITALGLKNGFDVLVRDREYALKRSEVHKPLAFISHDSRDKDALVRELAMELSRLMCPVWYDEYTLKVGDSLRSSIEKGLKETKKCVVILSPNFLSNEGWGRAEFDSIYIREILEKGNFILPVWHNVGVREVYSYSPRLADKVSLNSSLGISELARQLSNVIKLQGPDREPKASG